MTQLYRFIALASLIATPAFAQPADDPLQSPACLNARQQLDAAEAQGQGLTPQLRALRQQAADVCLRARADRPRPARLARPAEAVPSTLQPPPAYRPPRVAMPEPAAPTPAMPNQVTRCDDGGCWDSGGQRLNRVGNQLVGPAGQLCTQQGTVLVCH